MKKWLLNITVCFAGLALTAGCGGDGDGGSSNLDSDTQEIAEVLQEISSSLNAFLSPTTVMGAKRLAGMAVAGSLDRAFFNESIPVSGATSGSAVLNGNLNGSYSVAASEVAASVNMQGTFQTMVTFNSLVLQSGATINGRLSVAGDFSGNVSVNMSGSGSGVVEIEDTVQSQPDFTINGRGVSVLLTTEITATYNNGSVDVSGRQMGIIDGQSVNETF